MTQYIVSADHKVERHACKELEFRVGEYKHYPDNRISYYASAAGYGCSKNYRTPKDAIYGMLQEHACYNIHIDVVEE